MVCRSPHVSPVAFCPIDLFNIMFNTCFYEARKARKARSSFGTSHIMLRGNDSLVIPGHAIPFEVLGRVLGISNWCI